MKPTLRTINSSFVLLVLLGSCQSKQIDTTNPFESNGPVSFANHIMPVLLASCAGSGCHVGETTSGVNLSNRTAMLASVGEQYGMVVVVPGDAGASPLVDKISRNPQFGVRMPRERSPLSVSDINRISAWIDDGAPNN